MARSLYRVRVVSRSELCAVLQLEPFDGAAPLCASAPFVLRMLHETLAPEGDHPLRGTLWDELLASERFVLAHASEFITGVTLESDPQDARRGTLTIQVCDEAWLRHLRPGSTFDTSAADPGGDRDASGVTVDKLLRTLDAQRATESVKDWALPHQSLEEAWSTGTASQLGLLVSGMGIEARLLIPPLAEATRRLLEPLEIEGTTIALELALCVAAGAQPASLAVEESRKWAQVARKLPAEEGDSVGALRDVLLLAADPPMPAWKRGRLAQVLLSNAAWHLGEREDRSWEVVDAELAELLREHIPLERVDEQLASFDPAEAEEHLFEGDSL